MKLNKRDDINTKDKLQILLYVVTVIYSLILAGINFPRIFDNNFWADEAFSVMIVRKSVWGVIQRTAIDVHPPLYYVILKFIVMFGGYKPFMYHLASWIGFVLILVFSLTLIWRKLGPWCAITVITMAGWLDISLTYIIEARMYEWATLFCLCAGVFLYLIITENQKRWYVLFLISSVAAAYSHYYCVLTVCLMYMGLLIFAFNRKSLYLKPTLIISAIAILTYGPWVPVVLMTWVASEDGSWMSGYAGIKECFACVFAGKASLILWIIFIGLAAFYLIWIAPKKRKNVGCISQEISANNDAETIDNKRFNFIIIGIISTLGTIIIPVMVSALIEPILLDRYIYPSSSLIWLVMGMFVMEIRKRKIRFAIGAFISAVVLVLQAPTFPYLLECEAAEEAATQYTIEMVNKYLPVGIDVASDDDQICVMSRYYFPELRVQYANTMINDAGISDIAGDIWAFADEAVDNSEIMKCYDQRGGEILAENLYLGTHRFKIVRIDAID